MKIQYCCERMKEYMRGGYRYDEVLSFKKCPYCDAEIEVNMSEKKKVKK